MHWDFITIFSIWWCLESYFSVYLACDWELDKFYICQLLFRCKANILLCTCVYGVPCNRMFCLPSEWFRLRLRHREEKKAAKWARERRWILNVCKPQPTINVNNNHTHLEINLHKMKRKYKKTTKSNACMFEW